MAEAVHMFTLRAEIVGSNSGNTCHASSPVPLLVSVIPQSEMITGVHHPPHPPSPPPFSEKKSHKFEDDLSEFGRF